MTCEPLSPKRKKPRRDYAFTFSMEHQIESAVKVWARSPNAFSVSVETFARWLQVKPSDAPKFRPHQVVTDSETKQATYLNMYSAAEWCRYIMKHHYDASDMADMILSKIHRHMSKNTTITNDLFEAAESNSPRDMINCITLMIDSLSSASRQQLKQNL